jgi:hypothetical protein
MEQTSGESRVSEKNLVTQDELNAALVGDEYIEAQKQKALEITASLGRYDDNIEAARAEVEARQKEANAIRAEWGRALSKVRTAKGALKACRRFAKLARKRLDKCATNIDARREKVRKRLVKKKVGEIYRRAREYRGGRPQGRSLLKPEYQKVEAFKQSI